jgi:glycosyltransferase involved in cell wall biosynthesis
MKIRVLHCIETIASGGVEQVRLTLIRGLSKSQFQHMIVCTWEGGPVAEALRDEEVEIVAIGGFKHPFEWSKHKEVLGVIRRFKPHIVHGAVFEGMSMAAVSGTLGRVPVRILEETSEPINRSKKALLVQRMFSHLADKMIGISPSVCRFLIHKARVDKNKVMLINNGIAGIPSDLVKVSRVDLGLSERDVVLGAVGRVYNEVKRFSDILLAMARLKNPRLKFVLIGDGPDLKYLQEQAAVLELQHQFIPVGYHSIPHQYLGTVDVFIVPSAHEGFGLVAVEAMLHGIPVIASEVGGLKDVVIDGETGFLVPPSNPEAIADKINFLIQHPEVGRSMGERGRRRGLEQYNAERYCQQIEKLYKDLLHSKGIRVPISETVDA